MINFLLYIIQVSLCFSGLYLFFFIFTRKLSFHTFNRTFLLAILPVSVLLPLSTHTLPVPNNNATSYIPNFDFTQEAEFISQVTLETNKAFDWSSFGFLIYLMIMLFHVVRFSNSILKLRSLTKTAILKPSKGYKLWGASVVDPFSYFNHIFIPKEEVESCDPLILEHEKQHIRYGHSLDLTLFELYRIVFWINPLLYSYRNSLKTIHEFEADRAVLQSESHSLAYLNLLLQTVENQKTEILHNYFNNPKIKKRIQMISKNTSSKFQALRYLLIVPILALFLMAFNKSIKVSSAAPFMEEAEITVSKNAFVYPIVGVDKKSISSHYGEVRVINGKKSKAHGGIDIKANTGTPVVATADGEVRFAEEKGKWGNLIILKHSNGYETWNAHLQAFNVENGQKISRGDVIGYVGNTGLSSGPHLHFEIRLNGNRVNPLDLLED